MCYLNFRTTFVSLIVFPVKITEIQSDHSHATVPDTRSIRQEINYTKIKKQCYI
jgi:hypothetical protein